LLSCWVLDLLNPERLFYLFLTTDCQTCVQNSPYLFYLIRMCFRFFLLMIQHIMNTFSIFDILEYPWLFTIYNIFIISYLDCMAWFQMRWLFIYYVGKYYLVQHMCNRLHCDQERYRSHDMYLWVFYISSLFITENITIEPIDQYDKLCLSILI
jgi:hypothetical protein